MSKSASIEKEKESVNDGPRRVLEAQKSSTASSNRKGLQPGVANRVRVSWIVTCEIFAGCEFVDFFLKF